MFDRKKSELYNDSTDYVRGIIISVATRVEFMITIMLVNHFCEKEKRNDFHRYFMSSTLTFEQKKYPFSSLIKSNKLKIEGKYKGFIGDIDYIQNIRNLIAHSESNIKPDIVNNFNGEFIEFVSLTSDKGVRIIKVNLKEKTNENPLEFLYCINTFVERANRVIEVFKRNISDR